MISLSPSIQLAWKQLKSLTEIEVPAMARKTGTSFKQVARQAGESALVGVATLITLDDSGKVKDGRISFMGVSEKPVLALDAMKLLIGQKPSDELIRDAIEATVTNELDPGPDIHASAEYRRHMARSLGVKFSQRSNRQSRAK